MLNSNLQSVVDEFQQSDRNLDRMADDNSVVENVSEVVRVYHIPNSMSEHFHNYKCLIYDEKCSGAVKILRDKYRILTIPFGSLPNYIQQNVYSSLPCLITPESVSLGVEKGFIRVYEDLNRSSVTSLDDLLLNKKTVKTTNPLPSNLPAGHNAGISHNIYLFTMSYNQASENYSEIPQDITHLWKHPNTPAERNKYEVFKDLHWNGGFFLTSGDKFGCDFLAYRGDPVLHHAEYLVYVQEYDKPIESFQMISIGRLANNVHKTVLFASWNSQTNQVEYVNMNWFNPQPIKTWKIKELCNRYKEELATNQPSH